MNMSYIPLHFNEFFLFIQIKVGKKFFVKFKRLDRKSIKYKYQVQLRKPMTLPSIRYIGVLEWLEAVYWSFSLCLLSRLSQLLIMSMK